MAWKIFAKREIIVNAGIEDFGHLYIEIQNDTNQKIKQLHGYPYDPTTNTWRRAGYPLNSDDIIQGRILPDNQREMTAGVNDQSVLLYSGTQANVEKAVAYAQSALVYVNAYKYDYTTFGADAISDTLFNSNNVFSTIVDAMQQIIPIPQSAVDDIENYRIFLPPNPGAGINMFRGNEWRPLDRVPNRDANGNTVYGSFVKDTGETSLLRGTPYGDQLFGSDVDTDSNDSLYGGGGNDILNGLDGTDYLYGEAGDDDMFLGANDTAKDTQGNDEYFVRINWDSANSEYINIYDDDGLGSLSINADSNPLSGIAMRPRVNGVLVASNLWELGNYYLVEKGSGIIFVMRKDISTSEATSNPKEAILLHNFSRGQTRFGITLSSDIVGTSGADNLSGDTSSQRIEGGAGNDTIFGGSGNDSLYGQAGADSIRGGSGLDTYYYTLGEGQDTIADQGLANEADSVRIAGINSSQATYTRIGTSNDIRIGFTNNATDSILLSRALEVGTGNSIETILFSNDNVTRTADWIRATVLGVNQTSGNDTITAFSDGAGNDSITGSSLNDSLLGGDGLDTIRAGAGNDILDGGTGNDSLFGEAGVDSIRGGVGADSLVG